jgi:hypothetical protein
MNIFRNTDTHRRVWPGITKPDGTSLELGPSEGAELDLPQSFEDTYLKPVHTKAEQKEQKKAAKAEKDAADKAAKEQADKEVAEAAAVDTDKENQS